MTLFSKMKKIVFFFHFIKWGFKKPIFCYIKKGSIFKFALKILKLLRIKHQEKIVYLKILL